MQRVPGQSTDLDAVRAARMGGFGFAFYGPYQHYWYKYLDKLFPTKSVPHFASKVWQTCPEHYMGKAHLPRINLLASLRFVRWIPPAPAMQLNQMYNMR